MLANGLSFSLTLPAPCTLLHVTVPLDDFLKRVDTIFSNRKLHVQNMELYRRLRKGRYRKAPVRQTWYGPVARVRSAILSELTLGLQQERTRVKSVYALGTIVPFEKQAIRHLQSNKHLVIKRADKGGKIVLMNRNEYEAAGLCHLNELGVYKKLHTDLPMEIHEKVKSMFTALRGVGRINSFAMVKLTKFKPDCPPMYFRKFIRGGWTDRSPGTPKRIGSERSFITS